VNETELILDEDLEEAKRTNNHNPTEQQFTIVNRLIATVEHWQAAEINTTKKLDQVWDTLESISNKYYKLLNNQKNILLSNEIALRKLQQLKAILSNHYNIKIEEVDVFILSKFASLEENLIQLRQCKDFKGSYNQRLVDENIRLKGELEHLRKQFIRSHDRSDRLELELARANKRIDEYFKDN